LLKPTPTAADAAHVVRASFCPNPSTDVVEIVAQLDSYDDCNYKVCINHTPYLLKFHNGVESANFLQTWRASSQDYYKTGHASSVIHLQNAMFWTLQQHGIPTSAPVSPVNNSNGKNDNDAASDDNNKTSSQQEHESPVSIHTIPVADPTRSPAPLVVRLYEWIPGRPMSTIPVLALETLAEVGRMLGRVHTALDPLSTNDDSHHKLLVRAESNLIERQQQSLLLSLSSSSSVGPTTTTAADDDHQQRRRNRHLKDASLLIPARRFHQWDGKHTVELRTFLSYISIAKRRNMIESIIAAFDATIVQTGLAEKFRKGINHGDFNGTYEPCW
jgi:Phosphotransferase enzyme family